MTEPLQLAAIEVRHPLARNGLCALHQGDTGPCEARLLLDEIRRLQNLLSQCSEAAARTVTKL